MALPWPSSSHEYSDLYISIHGIIFAFVIAPNAIKFSPQKYTNIHRNCFMSTFDCLVTLYDTVVYDVNKYVEYITLRNYLNLQQKYSNQFMYLQFKS